MLRIATLSSKRADLAAALLGALSAAALPPVHALPVLLVTVPGLLALIDGAGRARAAARRGLWFGFGCHLVGLYWITEAILFEADRFWWLVPLAVPAVSLVLAVFIAVPCGLAWLAPPGWPRLVTLAGAWVLGDLARQFVATGFPWNLWGSMWEFPGGLGDLFIQPAAWVSIHGLTAATLLVAGVPALGRRAWAAAAAGLVAWIGIGAWRLSGPEPLPPGVAVVLAQGNIAQSMKWDRATAMATFRRYLDLSAQGVAEAVAADPGLRPLVVWPETASPFLLGQDQPARQAVATAANQADAEPGSVWSLVGSVRFDDRPENSLFAISPAGDIAAVYDKWHLVPFGEYQPGWLPGIQIIPGGGFRAGPGPATLVLPGLPPVGPIICYEAIFPGQVIDERARPAWMVNVTNDAWFGNSSGPRQHLAAARMRAVEEGLPLLRAANTGITAAFDAKGRELRRLEMGTEGVMAVRLPGALPATLFGRVGLAIPAGIGVLLVALGLGQRLRRRG